MKIHEPKIRLPYGISNFEKLVTEGNYYADKTPFLELLEHYQADYVSFLRPRRIGKSLFVSVMQYYYGKEHQDKFEKLFGQYYIGQNPTALANQFAVLKMDFSGIDTTTEERAYYGFTEKIKGHVRSFLDTYTNPSSEVYEDIRRQSTPELALQTLFHYYKNKDIYLIIDEYDHFTNEILIQDLQQFKRAVTKNGYVRKFYETIKLATQEGAIKKVFITGVSPVTLDSLTSGFNIIRHLTNELQFHDLMGFTDEEVEHVLDIVLVDKPQRANIIEDLQEWYNGYRFHSKSKYRIYNSDMVLYFFLHFQYYQEYPEEMLDPNIAPDYGKLKMMFEIQNPDGNYAVLEKILYQEQISDRLVIQFSFERGFSDSQFISFLYYMGYLTIEGGSNLETVFKIPNRVIKELYWEYFAWLITEREKLPYDSVKI